ncbi:MAG: hypothetical protein HY080_10275 [Gammaproteobacteria bacterium]|nr:hypothetical protein [Gammaproteobacteria bacterium]
MIICFFRPPPPRRYRRFHPQPLLCVYYAGRRRWNYAELGGYSANV